MAFFDALQYLQLRRIEIVQWPYAAEYRVPHSGRPMHRESHLHQPLYHRFGLRDRRAFLHDYEHVESFARIFSFCTFLISSIIRSKMRITASFGSGPGLRPVTFAKTWSSRLGS